MKHTKEYRLSLTDEARKIVEGMTLEEKVSLMGANFYMNQLQELLDSLGAEGTHYNIEPYPAGGIEGVIPPVQFCDGPRGVVCGIGKTTCFPVSMARGATFDPALEEQIGHAIGKEVRGFGGNLFAGVCINLPYNPGWGRSQETYGEETVHIGAMGAALTRGVQDEDVMACVKHYAFNQMENARFKVSVYADKRTEREVFLPHFKDCIDAGAAAIMSSYNLYNQVQCGHHKYLLSTVLKGEWDFDGFVMSDFIYGVKDTVEAANGGQDMEMVITNYFGDNLVKAVRDGFVPEEKVDEAALRIVRTIMAFDRDHKTYDMSVVGCPEHIALAKRAAEEAITLIKNEGVLPLDKNAIRKLAVVGKLADRENIGDHGSSRVYPAYTITPLQGIAKVAPDVEVVYTDGSDIETAKRAAAEADAVLIVAGFDCDDEGEYIAGDDFGSMSGAAMSVGGDRKGGLSLHADDIALIRAVGPMNQKSAVVMIGGNTITTKEWQDCAGALLMAYYPGQEGGTAIAEILFGDVNPSGKLPFVIPADEKDLPQVDWEATEQYYGYYHGYTKLDKEGVKPLYPYGFGLSYTTFETGAPEANVDGDRLLVKVTVKNTGEREGDEVVQVYAGYENSAVDRPLRQLCGFQRVNLAVGEEKTVEIAVPLQKLKWYNPMSREWELEKMGYTIYAGTSEALEDLKGTEIQLG
ncbi:MAG: glycoside hydrolase family 3 C-terminal domain-containing protein [Lachnospiraceae bacterium]|nr:glycoside hydrolase family 3 C-terminal domain-containing protein [Lachnospiraceae bacterium]